MKKKLKKPRTIRQHQGTYERVVKDKTKHKKEKDILDELEYDVFA